MINLNVIYEDNHIIVVEKPCNIPSQSDKTEDNDMITIIKSYLKEKYKKTGNVYLGLVHRLDRPVGGIMVFAKTSKAASRLSEDIRNNTFSKTYLAVAHGKFENKAGTLENYLKKDSSLNKSFITTKNKKDAKLALLDYEVIEEKEDLSLIRINLKTGRHHQIRVQFASQNHPLYGDQKYGTGDKGEQIALWAYKISFRHPTKKEIIEFECFPKKIGIWKKWTAI